jgi:hypothetical protein
VNIPTILASALAAVVALAPVIAGAQDEALLPLAADADCRVETIQAYTRQVERIVVDPPRTVERCVPTYEDVSVPVYENRQVPLTATVEVPVYETVEVPVYRTERVPVWGEKQVTAYREVRNPVTIEIYNPFTCDDECIELWDTCEEVPCGTRTVRAIVDYEARQVACGTRLERRLNGTRQEERITGYRNERIQVGERTERRLAGHRTEVVVTCPAQTRVVTACEPVPCESVTVVPDGKTRDQPLAGTSRILTESEYQTAIISARSSSSAGF